MEQFSYPNSQFVTIIGGPSADWKMYVYEASTTTLASIYSDAAKTIPTDNPIIADAEGFFASFYWTGTIDVEVTDENDGIQDSALGITDLQTEVLAIIAGGNTSIPSGIATGTGDAISVTLPVSADFADLAVFLVRANANNTGALNTPNLQVNAFPSRRILKISGEALLANDIRADQNCLFVYNSGDDAYYLINHEATFLRRDGSLVALGALNMGGFQANNVAAGSSRTDAPNIGQIQDGEFQYADTSKTITGNLTNLSQIVTGMVGALSLYAGQSVSGSGISGGTTIQSVDSDSQITLSIAATSTTTSALTFTGTANMLALFIDPRITTLVAGMAFEYVCAINNTGPMTVTIDGIAPVAITKNGANPVVADDNVTTRVYRITYDGTQFQLHNPSTQGALPGPVIGSRSALALSATGTNLTVLVSANELTVENTSNNVYSTIRNVSVNINTQSSGANGLDTGALAANTWYAVWVIYDGSGTAGLISLSATAPTLPGSYTSKARVGWIRTDSSADKYPLAFIQKDSRVHYKITTATNVPTAPVMSSGVAGVVGLPTFVAVPWANFAPSTASRLMVRAHTGATAAGVVIAAPSTNYSDPSGTNPPPVTTIASNGAIQVGDFMLESANIYWASNTATCAICALGWEDNI